MPAQCWNSDSTGKSLSRTGYPRGEVYRAHDGQPEREKNKSAPEAASALGRDVRSHLADIHPRAGSPETPFKADEQAAHEIKASH